MRALIAGPLVFVGALLVQFLVWRWRRPVGQYSGLVAVRPGPPDPGALPVRPEGLPK
jgi:hypothetical protein